MQGIKTEILRSIDPPGLASGGGKVIILRFNYTPMQGFPEKCRKTTLKLSTQGRLKH